MNILTECYIDGLNSAETTKYCNGQHNVADVTEVQVLKHYAELELKMDSDCAGCNRFNTNTGKRTCNMYDYPNCT